MSWYNFNWEYRKSITISGSTGAGTGYQVLLKVGESSGASGYDFHVEGNADNFPDDKGHSGDLLFTADDGTTLLPFWTEGVSGTTPNRVADIWVKVTSDLGTDQDIYCYYKNSDPLNISNGENTFDLFDEFVSLSYADQWTKDGSGTLNKGYGTLFTAGNGGQGLTTDGTYFYFGKSNGSGVEGTVYKYDFSGNLQTSFAGPAHAAGGSYRVDNDSIMFSTGGSETPAVWELSKTGTKLRSWDFTGEGYNRGALIAYKDADRIYLFTSDTSYNFKIQEYQINDDGTWNTVGIEYSYTSLGVPQGLTFYDGYLYYLFDNGISKLQFNTDGSITILETLSNLPGAEKEGLTHWGSSFYYGDSDKKIRIIYNEIIADFSTDTVYLTSKTAFGKGTALKLSCRTTSNTLDYPMWGYRSADGNERALIGKIHGANNYLQTQTKTSGNQTESGNIYAAQQNWTHYEIARGASSVRYYVEGTLKRTETSNVPAGSITVKLGGTTHSESGNFRVSWVFVRKYIDIEPAFSSADIQEENPCLVCFTTDIKVAKRVFENCGIDLSTSYESIELFALDLLTWAEQIQNLRSDINICLEDLQLIALDSLAAKESLKFLNSDLSLTDGILLKDINIDLKTTDGNQSESCHLDLSIIGSAPQFTAIYAMSLKNIKKIN